MFNVPLGEGAQIFIWIVCILLAFVNALMFTNSLATREKHKKSENMASEDKAGHTEEKRKVIL